MKSSIIIVISTGIAAMLLLYLEAPWNLITSGKEIDTEAQRELIGSLEEMRKQLRTLSAQSSKSQRFLQRRIEALEITIQNLPKTEEGFDWSENGEDDSEHSDETISREERMMRRSEAEHQQQAEEVLRLENEEIDADWSSLAEDQITQQFEADKKYDSREFEITCRSTHCAVRGEFGDSEERKRKISWFMTLIPWNTSGFYHADDIGGATGAIYVMRSEAHPDRALEPDLAY